MTTLGPKRKTIGFWNVRTLLEVGKLHQATAMMTSYKIEN